MRGASPRWPTCPSRCAQSPTHSTPSATRPRRSPGYAIGSAGLAALILFDEYARGLGEEGIDVTFSLNDPWVIAGLFVGGMMPFLFASLAMQAVGRVGGEVVRKFPPVRENPGIMEGTTRPDYSQAIGIVTGSAIR